MVPSLFILLAFIDPIHEIRLETKGWYLTHISFGSVRLTRDGDYLANNFNHIWHWGRDGRLLNRMGGRGEGPGEFESLSEVLWTGEYYWAIDGARGLSSIFDKNGRYLFRTPTAYRQFVQAEDHLFIVDYSRLNLHRDTYPRVLQEIKYLIDDENLIITPKGPPFKKVSRYQKDFLFNFKLVWVVEDGDRFLVVEQLDLKMRIYDEPAREAERSLARSQSFDPKFIPIQVKGWVEPPQRLVTRFNSNRQALRWWRSWSRINFFAEAGRDLVVGYEVPDPEDPLDKLQAVQRIGRDGRSLGEPLLVKGSCMGIKENRIFIFYADEQDEQFSYYVRIYDF